MPLGAGGRQLEQVEFVVHLLEDAQVKAAVGEAGEGVEHTIKSARLESRPGEPARDGGWHVCPFLTAAGGAVIVTAKPHAGWVGCGKHLMYHGYKD